MITGDNALTAMSVARQCHIVDKGQRIFLGDLSEKKIHGKDIILWKDFEDHEVMLNQNLEPDFECESRIIGSSGIGEGIPLQNENSQPSMAMLDDMERYGSSSNLMENLLTSAPKRTLSKRMSMTTYAIEAENRFLNMREYDDYCLAVTGRAFSLILEEAEVNNNPQYQFMLQRLLRKCLIFARTQPDEKALVVKHFMGIPNNVVGMCGDGANDVVALKTAHVGISLSEAEASVAAPFTSSVQDISCVPSLLREGKAALSTTYQEFKFMALYSIIQFTGVSILYKRFMDYSNFQYYHVDILTVLSLSATMAMTGSTTDFPKTKPTGRLFSVEVLLSVVGQVIIQAGFQIFTYALLLTQSDWYDYNGCLDNYDTGDACAENTSLYIVSVYQYCVVSLVFMVGKPFRKPFYTNFWYTFSFVSLMILNILVTYNPFDWKFIYGDTWDLEPEFKSRWKNTLMIIIIINSLATVIWEEVVVRYVSYSWNAYKIKKEKERQQKESEYHGPPIRALSTHEPSMKPVQEEESEYNPSHRTISHYEPALKPVPEEEGM